LLCASLAVLFPAPAQAIEDLAAILITPSLAPIALGETGSATTVISREELENRKTQLLSTLLREVPGFAVNSSGQPGALTQIRVRGAEANHIMVLIDGVKANDPRSGSSFDFGQLLAGDIERVEIVRGPQSALYGSDALAGVINIITRRGRGRGRIGAQLEAGSFGTVLGRASFGAGTDWGHLNLSSAYLTSKGINVSRSGSERDGYDNATVHAKGGVNLAPNVAFNAMVRYTKTKTEGDPQNFTVFDSTFGKFVDGSERTDQRYLYGRAEALFKFLNERWVNRFSVGLTDTKQDFHQDGPRVSGAEADRLRYTHQSNLTFDQPIFGPAKHVVSTIVQREELTFRNDPNPAFFFVPADLIAARKKRRDHQNSIAGEYRVAFSGRLFLTAGGRYDDNSRFKDTFTHRLTGAFRLHETNTRLHTSYGTGVKNPDFFELFGFNPNQFIGNAGLLPEKSTSFDIGIEQRLFDNRLVVDVTFFTARLRDEIVTVGFAPSMPINLNGKSKRRGVEVSVTARPRPYLTVKGAYTYINSRQPNGMLELRRPKHIASLNINHAFDHGRANVNLGINYNGRQEDTDFGTGMRVTLDNYTLVKLVGSYAVTPAVTVYGRVENLLDQSYEQVFSQRSPGIAAYAGLKVNFQPGPAK
jgi:vitamin B12 transporter